MRDAPWSVRLWFAWAFFLLAMTGLLLPRIIEFVDPEQQEFHKRASFVREPIYSRDPSGCVR